VKGSEVQAGCLDAAADWHSMLVICFEEGEAALSSGLDYLVEQMCRRTLSYADIPDFRASGDAANRCGR